MKKLLKLSLFSLLFLSFACSEDNDTLTGNENTGGLLTDITSAVLYAQGSDPSELMNVSFSTFHGREKTEKVDIYVQYFRILNAGTDEEEVITSNNKLMTTFNVSIRKSNRIVIVFF